MKILILDDEESIRNLYKDILKDECYEFYEASTCEEAFEYCSNVEFDIIFLDIRLNGESGFDFSTKVKNEPDRYHNPKIIAISAFLPDEIKFSEENRKKFNITSFLEKPFDIEIFTKRIKQLVKATGA